MSTDPPPDEATVEARLAAGDLRGAAECVRISDPARAAGLFARLHDHRAAAEAWADADRTLDAVRAAIRADAPALVARLHTALLTGARTGLPEALEAYVAAGRPDLASEAAQALGDVEGAARWSEEAGDHHRGGRLWASVGRLLEARAAFERGGAASRVELGRVLLRLRRPRRAAEALSTVDTAEARRLRTLAYLDLDLIDAARVLDEALPTATHALARARESLRRSLAAEPPEDRIGPVEIDALEPGSGGRGFLGRLDGRPVAVRLLDDDAGTMLERIGVLTEPPLPGTPPTLELDLQNRWWIVQTVGSPLPEWRRGVPPDAGTRRVVRVLCEVARTLAAAHERGLVHGALEPGSIRVGPADVVQVDGWHRADRGPSGATRLDPTSDRFAAPEVLVGGEPGPPADVHALGSLAAHLLVGAAVDALAARCRAQDPGARPGLDAVRRDLARLAPIGSRPTDDVPDASIPTGPRFVPHADGGFEDTRLGRRVERIEIAPTRRGALAALAAPGMPSIQEVLAIEADGAVVLEWLSPSEGPAPQHPEADRDLRRLAAAGVDLPVDAGTTHTRRGKGVVRIAGWLADDPAG